MAHHAQGPEKRNQLQNGLNAVPRNPTNHRVDGAGPEVHERGMKGNGAPRLSEAIRYPPIIIDGKSLQGGIIEADLRIDAFPENQVQIMIMEVTKGHMDLKLS